MRLYLDVDGIDLYLQITQYRKSAEEYQDEEWCQVEFTLQSREWLNYQMGPTEAMLCYEVEHLRDRIEELLNGKLDSPEEVSCIEPDFEFHFFPEADCRENPNVLYVKPGCEIIEATMDWIVSFYDGNGALTSNRLFLSLNRTDLEKLVCYLNLVTGIINEDDKIIHELTQKGNLIT